MTTSEHAGWVEVDPDRWTWAEPDGSRHLLLKAGDHPNVDRIYVELHGSTLHRYVQVGETPLALNGDALHMTADLQHRDSITDESLLDMTDAEVWQRMLNHGWDG